MRAVTQAFAVMWVLLLAVVAAPVPAPVSVYTECVAASSTPSVCPFLVSDVWYSVYCCADRVPILNPELEGCKGPAALSRCTFLVTTTFNSWCCDDQQIDRSLDYDTAGDDYGLFFS